MINRHVCDYVSLEGLIIDDSCYRLARVIVRRPDDAFGGADYKKWHYTAPIHLHAAQQEHDEFCATLRNEGMYQRKNSIKMRVNI